MGKLSEYQRYFHPDVVPAALVKLIEFEATQDDFFSESFELDCSYFDRAGLKTYSDDPAFLDGLREFAQADGTGSTYALWRKDGSFENAPVVVFGSEGGVHVVAENLPQLFRILTLDAEPMVGHEEVIYYRDPDNDEATSGAAVFVRWLAKNFKLKPVADMEEAQAIAGHAQAIHEKSFLTWLARFYAAE